MVWENLALGTKKTNQVKNKTIINYGKSKSYTGRKTITIHFLDSSKQYSYITNNVIVDGLSKNC